MTTGRVPLTHRALTDLILTTTFVWVSVLAIHRFDLPAGLTEWNATHQHWAIDELTLVSLCVVAALGVFSWRRWQESMRTIERHTATLERLQTTESEIASRDELIRSVSHELRTPLTAILGYAELLGSPSIESAERVEMVHSIIRGGRDLSNIEEDLLTRARSEADTLEVASVRVSLAGQAAQVLEGWTREERDHIGFLPDPVVVASGDPARIRQILRNLVSNAFKYGEGDVALSMGAAGEQARLAVSNRGPAIPEADRDRIFDPYHRVPGNAPAPGGLGLGLTISRELARMMQGDLTYRHEADRSIFELTLPLYAE